MIELLHRSSCIYLIKTARIPLLFLMLFVFLSCRSSENTILPEEKAPQPFLREPVADEEHQPANGISGPEVDVDSLMVRMSLEEKIGQLFMIPAYGRFTNEHDRSLMRLKRLVTEYKVGGIIFMSGDIYGQAVLTNKLQELAPIPLWVGQDMEYGAAMRVQGTTRFTPAMGIAATGNPSLAYLKGKVTAREAKALGVHQIFAPVLDVNNNPENPVINVRSYSSDPNVVARFGQYFIDGVESEGLLATAKHFPGHGDTDTDSHLALPVINHNYARIDSLELVPFRTTINNGLKGVMSAHIAYPKISENIGLPGTLDESILNRILVDSLNFDGLVVTDGLEMRGITEKFSPGEAVIQALLAGADMMLISPDVMTAVHELKLAVKSGRISEERIDQSVKKILQLKKHRGVFEHSRVDIDDLSTQINTPDYQTIANRIARSSITILKDDSEILPIREVDYHKIVVVGVTDGDHTGPGSSLARELRNYHSGVKFHSLNNSTSEKEIDDMMKDADDADLVIIGSFIIVRSHQPIQMPREHLRVLRKLTHKETPSVLVAFGNPYVARDLPDTDVYALAWSSDSNQIRQTVPGLFGAADIRGKFPASIPGMYAFGDGRDYTQSVLRYDEPGSMGLNSDSLLNIDTVMQSAIEDSTFPGGVVAVMRKGVLVWHEAYGYHDYQKTRAMKNTDIFDLASVTKVMATTTSIMKLVDEGRIQLDDKVADYIPEFQNGKKAEVTIEQLLLHTSGLPAFQVYVDVLKTRAEIVDAIRNEPLINEPGEKYVYSDLGFILLGEIVEQVSGTRLDRFIRSRFFYPMEMKSTHFNPAKVGRWLSDQTPPTEIDNVFNRGIVQGVVHDERAYFMDGVAGHAGLFGSARDLAIYSYMLLNEGYYGGREYLSPEVIEMFTSRRSLINQRGYGFDRKGEGLSTAGLLTSERTFGHLGFTGTSIWIDPDQEIAIILLTNRTFPSRTYGGKISLIRAQIADTVMKSIEQ